MTRITTAILVGLGLASSPVGYSGWTGSMNGSGFGKASVNVTSSTLNNNVVTSAVMQAPSAAMVQTAGYSAGGPLPSGASSATVARILGKPGYIWQNNTTAANGDKADNDTLADFVVPVSSQATTTFEVLSVTVDPEGCAPGQALYTVTWHWTGTDAGTAQMVRFFEYAGALPTDPSFHGDVGVLVGATQVTDAVVAVGGCGETRNSEFYDDCVECEECDGSFDSTYTMTFCATADTSKLYMVTDGIAVSLPCAIQFTGFQAPLGGADATGGSCDSPLRVAQLGSKIPVKMKLVRECDGDPVTTGNHTIQVTKCNGGPTLNPSPNVFDAKGPKGEWHYNLDTKKLGMTAGTWKISVTLSNGEVHEVYVNLKSNGK